MEIIPFVYLVVVGVVCKRIYSFGLEKLKEREREKKLRVVLVFLGSEEKEGADDIPY